jgi:hypothetical protein
VSILSPAHIGRRHVAPGHQPTASSAVTSIVRHRAKREMAQVVAEAARRDDALARLQVPGATSVGRSWQLVGLDA